MKKFDLKKKLIFLFMAIGILPLTVLSIYTYKSNKTNLLNQSFADITSLKANKINNVKRYFSHLKRSILTFNEDTMVLDTMSTLSKEIKNFRNQNKIYDYKIKKMREELKKNYQQEINDGNLANDNNVNFYKLIDNLDKNSVAIQSYYLSSLTETDAYTDHSKYGKKHKEVHDLFLNIAERFGFEDIYLIDSKTEQVIYSIYKKNDFATSLETGQFSKSGLGKVFSKAKFANDDRKVSFVDFSKYSASIDKPSAFIASSLFKNGESIGVLVFQITNDSLAAIMDEKNGESETSETYLVGSDGKLRSDTIDFNSRFNMFNSFDNPSKFSIKSDAFNAGLNKGFGTMIGKNYNQETVLSSFSSMNILGNKWVLISEVSLKERMVQIEKFKWWTIYCIGFCSLVIFLIGIFFSKHVSDPLLHIARGLTRQSDEVKEISTTILSSSDNLLHTTTQQSSAIEETVSSMEEMAAMLQQTSSSADSGLKLAAASQSDAETGAKVVSKMVHAMDEIQMSNTKLETIVKSINEIEKKTKVINDIVSETKLLSFNASIEAARAGVHGKGFSVVAEEIGNLAIMSGTAAEEIRTLLDSSIIDVNGIVIETKEKVQVGKDIAEECRTALETMGISLNSITSSIEMINTASKEQESGVKQTNIAMNEMEKITQSNSTNSTELAHKSKELRSSSTILNGTIEELKGLILGVGNEAMALQQSKKSNIKSKEKSEYDKDNIVNLDFSQSSEIKNDQLEEKWDLSS